MPNVLEQTLDAAADNAVQLRAQRTERFDFRGSLFYSPMGYVVERVAQARTAEPRNVYEDITAFVRDEFASRIRGLAAPPDLPTTSDYLTSSKRIDFLDTAGRLLDSLEKYLVYGDRARAMEIRLKDSPPAHHLFELFRGEDFGRRENAKHVSPKWFASRLDDRLDPRTGVHFTIPCLPYRDQNPFRCPNSPTVVTLAEAIFLAWLHTLSLAVFRFLPGGAHTVCLTDGSLYADTLGVTQEAAASYYQNLRRLRDALNLTRTVSIVDLRRIAERVAEANGLDFWDLVTTIKRQLRDHILTDNYDESTFRSLIAGIRWNIASNSLGDTADEIWRVLSCDPTDLLSAAVERDDVIASSLLDSALGYSAINIALRHVDPISTAFPDAIRLTMHPKPGQVGIHRFGSVFPWNGVATLGHPTDPLSLTTQPLHALYEAGAHWRPLMDDQWGAEEVLGFEFISD